MFPQWCSRKNALSVEVSSDENVSYCLFYFHSRSPKRFIAPSRDVARCMRFNFIDSLHAVSRRNLYNKHIVNRSGIYSANIYSLTPIRYFTGKRPAKGNETDRIISQINFNAHPNNNGEDKIDVQVIYIQQVCYILLVRECLF